MSIFSRSSSRIFSRYTFSSCSRNSQGWEQILFSDLVIIHYLQQKITKATILIFFIYIVHSSKNYSRNTSKRFFEYFLSNFFMKSPSIFFTKKQLYYSVSIRIFLETIPNFSLNIYSSKNPSGLQEISQRFSDIRRQKHSRNSTMDFPKNPKILQGVSFKNICRDTPCSPRVIC